MRVKDAPGVSKILTTKKKYNKENHVSILIIGNSFVYSNSMPRMLIDISNSDKNNNTSIEIQSIAEPRADLKKLWKDGITLNILQRKPWDYLILQEHNLWASRKNCITDTTAYTMRFAEKAEAHGTKTIFFKPWVFKNDSNWYKSAKYKHLKNSQLMHQINNKHTDKLLSKINIGEIPISDYWLFTEDKYPNINLYDNDEYNPSILGSYLTALILYKYLTGNSPLNATYAPIWISDKDAQTIRQIATYGSD